MICVHSLCDADRGCGRWATQRGALQMGMTATIKRLAGAAVGRGGGARYESTTLFAKSLTGSKIGCLLRNPSQLSGASPDSQTLHPNPHFNQDPFHLSLSSCSWLLAAPTLRLTLCETAQKARAQIQHNPSANGNRCSFERLGCEVLRCRGKPATPARDSVHHGGAKAASQR